MARAIQVLMVPAAIFALLLAGCSGAGVPTVELRGGDVQEFAADNLAALVLVKGWLTALRAEPELGGPCEPEFQWEILPDGSLRLWGTNRDCSRYDFVDTGGGGEGTWVLSDGREVWMRWEIVEDTGATLLESIEKVFWDGARMQYTALHEVGAARVTTTREGTLTLPDTRTMEFTAVQVGDRRETVSVSLPDGSRCGYELPLGNVGLDHFVPLYDRGLEGSYVSPSGVEHTFTATGDADGLTRWIAQGDRIRGQFTIDDRYAGQGMIRQDGDVAASLDWDSPAQGNLALVLAGSAEVGPSGAALDFAVDRWIQSSVALGPTPMY